MFKDKRKIISLGILIGALVLSLIISLSTINKVEAQGGQNSVPEGPMCNQDQDCGDYGDKCVAISTISPSQCCASQGEGNFKCSSPSCAGALSWWKMCAVGQSSYINLHLGSCTPGKYKNEIEPCPPLSPYSNNYNVSGSDYGEIVTPKAPGETWAARCALPGEFFIDTNKTCPNGEAGCEISVTNPGSATNLYHIPYNPNGVIQPGTSPNKWKDVAPIVNGHHVIDLDPNESPSHHYLDLDDPKLTIMYSVYNASTFSWHYEWTKDSLWNHLGLVYTKGYTFGKNKYIEQYIAPTTTNASFCPEYEAQIVGPLFATYGARGICPAARECQNAPADIQASSSCMSVPYDVYRLCTPKSETLLCSDWSNKTYDDKNVGEKPDEHKWKQGIIGHGSYCETGKCIQDESGNTYCSHGTSTDAACDDQVAYEVTSTMDVCGVTNLNDPTNTMFTYKRSVTCRSKCAPAPLQVASTCSVRVNNQSPTTNDVVVHPGDTITYGAEVRANRYDAIEWINSKNCIGGGRESLPDSSGNYVVSLSCPFQLSGENLDELSDLNNLAAYVQADLISWDFLTGSSVYAYNATTTCPDVSLAEQDVGPLGFECTANQAGATCHVSSGHGLRITNAAASGHPSMAVSIGTNSNANDWGHFESSGLGSLIPGQVQNLSGNDLRFVLNTSKTIAKDQTVTIDKTLIITAQDANAPVSSWLSPAYVTINLKGVEAPPPSNQAPTNVNAEAVSSTAIKVTWNNPQDYPGGVEIKVFNKTHPDPSDPSTGSLSGNRCKDETYTGKDDIRYCWKLGANLTSGEYILRHDDSKNPLSYTVTDLFPGTTYEVIVRGYLKTH